MDQSNERQMSASTPEERPFMSDIELEQVRQSALLVGALSLRMEVRAGMYAQREYRDVNGIGPVLETELFELAASCVDVQHDAKDV